MIDDEVKLAPRLPAPLPPNTVAILGATLDNSRVGISVLDADGQSSELWMDVPNAMYLMNLLNGIWIRNRTPVPAHAPATVRG